MLTRTRSIAVAVVAAITSISAPAVADDNGIAASIHDLRREGGRLCFSDHWHYGSGSGATKAAAQRDAVGSWQSFTAFEYGSDWASLRRAAAKRISCSGGAGSYSCQIEARPCR